MNSINKHDKRKSRPNAGRGGRMRAGGVEKTAYSEGVYNNSRLTYVATSIVGCVVQIEVKNGNVYEGILKTFSPKMDVVLELAHKIDEGTGYNSVPSKDRILDTVIFNLSDVVCVTALNVDCDYATKEAFIDSAISSKFNGQAGEKELQPWDGEAQAETSALEAIETPTTTTKLDDNSNGWDPNDMFKINAERFDVQSSYDPSLSQYTTPLKQENTKEYRDREARAAKLAQEIERSDGYKNRAALENGDGDEEDKFSAVIRPGDQSGASGKYVPPHLRKNPGQGRALRTTPQQVPGSKSSEQNSPQPSPTQHTPPVDIDNNFNDENEDEVDQPVIVCAESENNAAAVDKEQSPPLVVSNKPVDRKSSNPNARDEKVIKELKEFSTNFRLETDKEKRASPALTHHVLTSPTPATPSSGESVSSMTQPSPSPQRASPATPTVQPTTTPTIVNNNEEKLKKKKVPTATLR